MIQNYYAEFDLVLFKLLAFSGVRVGEALTMQQSEINQVNKTLIISKKISQTKAGYAISTPKTKQSNHSIISLDDKTLLMLKKWHLIQRKLMLKNSINTNIVVFTTLRNTFMTRNDVYQCSSRTVDAVGLHKINYHGFRHPRKFFI